MPVRMRDLLQLYLSLSGQHIVVTSLSPQVIVPHTIGLRGDSVGKLICDFPCDDCDPVFYVILLFQSLCMYM